MATAGAGPGEQAGAEAGDVPPMPHGDDVRSLAHAEQRPSRPLVALLDVPRRRSGDAARARLHRRGEPTPEVGGLMSKLLGDDAPGLLVCRCGVAVDKAA